MIEKISKNVKFPIMHNLINERSSWPGSGAVMSREGLYHQHWFVAAADGKINDIQCLLHLGIDVGLENERKDTALHLAVTSRNKELVSLLINSGATIDSRDGKLNTALHIAVFKGYLEIVSILLSRGADINATNGYSYTPLHMAAENGYKEIVSLLLDGGSDVDARNSISRTALQLAAAYGHKNLISLLLDHGADISATDEQSYTAVHLATKNRHETLLVSLLEHGAAVDAKDAKSNTALHIAAFKGYEEIVKLFVRHGAYINATNDYLSTALHLAVANGHKESVVSLLDSGAGVEAKNDLSKTALHLAVENGHRVIVSLLLNHGATVKATDGESNTSLHIAAFKDHQGIVQLLLNHGADVNATNDYLYTALHLAAENGHRGSAGLLLEAATTVDAKNIYSRTALHLATEYQRKGLVSLLLDYGAAIDTKDGRSTTALHIAAFKGYEEIVKLLLSRGASVNARNDNLYTALHLAAENGHKEAASVLLDVGASIDTYTRFSKTALHLAVEYEHKELVSLLLNRGATVDATDGQSNTALHIATENGNKNLVSLLLDHDAAVDAKDGKSRTALEIAANEEFTEVAELLLNHGADIKATNEKGKAPLLVASKASQLQMVSFLLFKGAYVEATDSDSLTALHWASKEGNLELVKLLLVQGAKLETKTDSGDTALHIAAKFNQMDTATALMQHGANINAKNQENQTPVYIAILQGHADMVCLLLDAGAEVKDPDGKVLPLIYIAADTGKVEVFKRALDMISDVNDKAHNLNSTLLRASQHGHVNFVTYLLDNGADIETHVGDGLTPMFLAGDHPELMAMLLHRGADVEARKENNQTALQYYAAKGQAKALGVLLNYGCNIQSTDKNGNTALHHAAYKNEQEVAFLLIEKGIDIDTKNEAGETALHIAIRRNFLDLAEMLIDQGIDLELKESSSDSTALHIAVETRNESSIVLLLSGNADVNGTNRYCQTALHIAVEYRLTKEAELIIKYGANVNAMTNKKWTPLHIATTNCNPIMVKMLLDNGALSNVLDVNDISPLMNAVTKAKLYLHATGDVFLQKITEVIALLIEAGANTADIQVPEALKRRLPALANILSNTTTKASKNKLRNLHTISTLMDEDVEEVDSSGIILIESGSNLSNEQKASPRYKRGLIDIKHKYGFGFPSSRKLRMVDLDNSAKVKSLAKPKQPFQLLNSISMDDRARTIIASLFDCLGVKLFTSDAFLMLELHQNAKQMSPKWALPFDKFQGMIRRSGQLIVQIPLPEFALSVLGRHIDTHPLLCFMDSVYICRRTSPRVNKDAFSDILGESEGKLATDFHAMLIAGLSVLSIAGDDGHIDMLVKAILGKLDHINRSQSKDISSDWQVLNRIRCDCTSQSAHRPLFPVAAAKAVGIDIWRERQEEIVPRVWDLNSDRLVSAKKSTEVIFITHTWNDHEVGYMDVKGIENGSQYGISTKSTKLYEIREALRKYIRYVWIDTLCIDKSNLTELDEAIRSMYKWYANCVAVVLEYGTPFEDARIIDASGNVKIKNGWCKRGWCLQEGAAAGFLCGISKSQKLVSMQQLATEQSHELCTLDLHLNYRPGNAAEILARMDARETTRKEDKAYALAGIFSIHFTLAYGEGLKSRERLLHQLATQKGDLSFLSFPNKDVSHGNHLPGVTDVNYLLALCRQSSAPATVSHFGICFEVQLVEGVNVGDLLNKLNHWKDLKMATGRFSGVTELIEAAKSSELQGFSNIKLGIVHDIRSIMLLVEYGEDWQTGGGRAIKLCYRLQCCQIEEDEFERLFDNVKSDYGISAPFEKIWLGDKPASITMDRSRKRKRSTHPNRNQAFHSNR